MVLPTGNAATKLMKVSGSLTAGGGAGRCFCCRLASWPDPERDSASVRDAPPPADPPAGASFLPLAFFSGAAFLDVAFFLVAFRDFSGSGGCRASSTASSTALEKTGLSLARPGGGAAGVIGQDVSTAGGACLGALFRALEPFLAAFLAALASSAALAGAELGSFFALASAVAARLLGPRMGSRGVKIQPTPGTGLPPISLPSSNSQGCSPWNSWKESLDKTVAPVRSAIRNTNASPRPMAPAGGEMTSPLSIASRTSSRSASPTRCSKVASTTTMMLASGSSEAYARTASSSCSRLGNVRPSVARLDPSTTTWCDSANGPSQQVGLLQLVQGGAPDGGARRLGPADMAEPEALGQAGVEAGMHEGPGSHVLGLLLQPHHFGCAPVALEDRCQERDGPGIELVHPHDRHAGRLVGLELGTPLPGLMGDLPAAQHDAVDGRGVLDRRVVDHVLEGTRLQVGEGRARRVGPQHRLGGDHDERPLRARQRL